MPGKFLSTRVCASPGCPAVLVDGSTRCPAHAARRRDSDRDRRRPWRYNDAAWRRNRANFLRAHPRCIDCGAAATVADHAPIDRVELIARGEPHPDAWEHLQSRCESCHNRRTARTSRRHPTAGGGGANRGS
jgi:5-methylcytosine-specific restriction protein A